MNHHEAQQTRFYARVAIPGGGSATGHGSETRSDFIDYIEKAETKALGRALHALGFDLFDDPASEASPAQKPRQQRSGSQPVRDGTPGDRRSPGNPRDRLGSRQEPEMVAWTEFWRWARAQGYRTRADVERALGGSIEVLPPAEVKKLLEAL